MRFVSGVDQVPPHPTLPTNLPREMVERASPPQPSPPEGRRQRFLRGSWVQSAKFGFGEFSPQGEGEPSSILTSRWWAFKYSCAPFPPPLPFIDVDTSPDEHFLPLKRPIWVRTKTNRKNPPPALAKGQLWKMDHTHIQIVDLGKMLVHYKMLRELGQMRRTQMSRIESMEDYLKTNEAQLVKSKTPRQSLKPVSLPSCRRSGLRKGH